MTDAGIEKARLGATQVTRRCHQHVPAVPGVLVDGCSAPPACVLAGKPYRQMNLEERSRLYIEEVCGQVLDVTVAKKVTRICSFCIILANLSLHGIASPTAASRF